MASVNGKKFQENEFSQMVLKSYEKKFREIRQELEIAYDVTARAQRILLATLRDVDNFPSVRIANETKAVKSFYLRFAATILIEQGPGQMPFPVLRGFFEKWYSETIGGKSPSKNAFGRAMAAIFPKSKVGGEIVYEICLTRALDPNCPARSCQSPSFTDQIIAEYARTRLERMPAYRIPIRDVYEDFHAWHVQNVGINCPSKSLFGRRIEPYFHKEKIGGVKYLMDATFRKIPARGRSQRLRLI